MSETFQTDMAQPAPVMATAPKAELPDADEFFGAPAEPTGSTPVVPQLPTADDFFSPQQSLPNRVAAGVHDYIMRGLALPRIFTQPMEGPVADQLLERATTGRILDAFGQGAKQGWGEGELGLSEESQKWLREAGIFNDYAKGRSSVIKAFNEALIRPGALILDTGLRSINAAMGGVSGLIGQTTTEAGGDGKALERDLNLMMSETFAGMPFALANPRFPVNIPKARQLGIIGEGEGAWKGTVERKPVPESVLADTVRAQDEAEVAGGRPTGTPEDMALQPGESMPAEPQPPDIHQTARMVSPEVFRQYDELQGRAETFRRWIGELDETRRAEAAKPFNERIAELQSQMEGASARNAKRYQAEIDEQTVKRDAALAEIKGDSPDMARIRQELLNADIAMRDLAPEVSRAYREAEGAMPRVEEPAPAVAPEAVRAADEGVPIAPEAPAAAPEAIAASETAPARQTELPLGPAVDIAGDVADRLKKATPGRSDELVRAEAAITASHYEARAARLGITAQELYARETPDIRGREKGRKGATGQTAFKDGKTIVTLFKDSDASTFMHETGHVWLRELMADAKLEQAVESLRADAAAVRKWLGASAEGPFTRGQEEKFARGFERYLMEGRAPNEKLAGVFEQFRKWLTDIYQSVARLRSPITDEIRSVFDRLIAPEREGPPVITETEPSVARFAEKHETRARDAKPEAAAKEADAIATEAQDIIRTLPEDIQDAINRGTPEERPAAEAGRREPPDAQPADTGVAGERPAPDGAAERPGAEQPGGGGVAPSGAGTRVLERPRAAEAQPVGPNDPIPPSETRLLDKAGNIRIDNLNVPEDVAQAIRQAADENEGFIGARRGVVSDAQVLDLADALGMDAAMLSTRKLGEAFNAEQIMAARKLLVQSATDVRNLMAKAGDPLASDADVLAYGAAKARHMMIQEQVAGLTAEAGRALRAFRAIEGMADAEGLGAFLKENAGTTLYQLRREATLGKELDTPQKVSKFINDSKRATFSDMILEFWINGLLSGPITQVKNIAGNTVVALNRVAETGLAAMSGEVRQALGVGARERVLPGEVAATMYGALRGAQDGVVAAWHAFKTEEIQYGAGTMDQRKFQAIPSARITIAGQELELGGKQVRIPGRLLQATDEFFKAVAHRQELNAIGYREAVQSGLTGDAFLQKIAQVVQNPTDEQMLAARRAAEYQTFTRALGPTGRAIQNFANSYPLLKVVLPFIRTPTNIIKYAAERSPLGFLSREIRDNLAGRNGGVAQDTQIARMAMGSMLATAAVGLALEGFLSGSGPSDVNERAALRATGWQPNSVKIGDAWYSYEWLDPFSTILGIASGITEAAEKLPQAIEDEELSKVAAMGFGSVAKDIMGKLSLRGASDLIKAVTDPDRYGAKYIQNLTGTLVPTSLAQIARTQDPIQRESRTMLDSVKMRLPGMRETLFPKRDWTGEPIVSEGAAGPDAFSPLYQSTVKNDPAVKWLTAIEVFPTKAPRKIRGVELTDQQYDDYARISGRLMKARLDAIVNQPGVQQAPVFVQREMAKNAIEESREAARSMIMMQYPMIMQTAVNDKIRVLQGGEPKKGALKQPE